MKKFNNDLLKDLPIYLPEKNTFQGEFYNENNLLTGAYLDSESRLHLIVQSDNIALKSISLQGVEITGIKVVHPVRGEKIYLDYCPTHSDFLSNVMTVCNEIIEVVEKGANPEEATRKVLKKWNYFLSVPRSGQLTEEQITGLFGELLVIEKMLLSGKKEDMVISGWLGPQDNPRDFEFDNYWIEVKSTTGKDQKTEIHGLEQLSAKQGIPLYLWLILLEKENEGISLMNLIESIEKQFTSAIILLEFRDKLCETGFHYSDAEYYSAFKFKFKNEFIFTVDDDFPKITGKDITKPGRVVKIGYTVDLSGLNHKIYSDVI